jgi:DNA helicase IV
VFPTKTDLSTLNDKQREAAMSDANRILVVAGTGSGKTKTLLQKIIYLIEDKGVSPHHILAITFRKNATNEVIDRLIVSGRHYGLYEKDAVRQAGEQESYDSVQRFS